MSLRAMTLTRAVGSHDCDFSSRPCKVHIASKFLATHDYVCATVSLTEYYRDLRNRCLGVCVEHLCAVPYDSALLLRGAGHETGNVNKE